MNILYIDTSSSKEIEVGLEIDGKRKSLRKKIGTSKAQATLPMIDDLLKKNSLKVTDVNEIKVNTGPGSFTGLRVGMAIANALSFALEIPINGKKAGEVVAPQYQ